MLLTAYSQKDLIERAKEAGVFAYLVKPFQESDLMPAIEIAIARYLNSRTSKQTVGNLEQKLETRKLVDRAKGILMDKLQDVRSRRLPPNPAAEHEPAPHNERDRRGDCHSE